MIKLHELVDKCNIKWYTRYTRKCIVSRRGYRCAGGT